MKQQLKWQQQSKTVAEPKVQKLEQEKIKTRRMELS
jgi:hypothetical protein